LVEVNHMGKLKM